ncbi:MAG: 5'-nucleotidase, partial [Cyanobacteria bacterium P01_H01_bin.58]
PEDTDGVRTQETNLGNLTADANLAEAQAADATVVLSLKNGGGIRASIGQTVVPAGGTEAERLPNEEVVDSEGNLVKPEGGISQNDIQTTLAFNNSLTLLTLTKSEIVGLLEHGVSAIPGVSGRFPQIAGVKFSYDPDLAEGDRILSAGIFDEDDNLIAELVRDGEIVGDVNEEFRMVTLDFLARPRFDDNGDFIGGGDGYSFPNLNDPDVIARVNPVALEQEGVQTGDATFADDGTEQDALAEYLLDNFNTPETAFVEVDTGRNLDERIQNLNFREDTVLPDIFEQVLQIGLFDADTDELIVSLTDGVAIQSSLLAGVDATIAAFVPDGSPFFNEVQSIFLDLNNGEVTQQENVEPYALFGDSNGDFRSGDLALNLGANSISFDLFSENNLGGELLDTVVVDFTVEGSVIPVVEVGLYDAATDELLQVLQDGAIIESSTLPNDLTIAALVLDNSSLAAPVESIAFDFNNGGVNQVENVEPYALFGDSNGDFRGGLDLAPGSNTIELELYSQSRARGQLLDTIAIDFTVV